MTPSRGIVKKRREKAERRADAMIRRQENGYTLEAIGEHYGISRQRVHEIIKWRRES